MCSTAPRRRWRFDPYTHCPFLRHSFIRIPRIWEKFINSTRLEKNKVLTDGYMRGAAFPLLKRYSKAQRNCVLNCNSICLKMFNNWNICPGASFQHRHVLPCMRSVYFLFDSAERRQMTLSFKPEILKQVKKKIENVKRGIQISRPGS